MKFRIAVVLGFLALQVCPAGAQTARSGAPWTGTITANIISTDKDFDSLGIVDCKLAGTSARCTYTSTTKYTGKDPYVITETAKPVDLLVSITTGPGEWKMKVAAFLSKGTKTTTVSGKSFSADNVHLQAPDWEVPIPAPRDPNKLIGSWKNSIGNIIKWDLSR